MSKKLTIILDSNDLQFAYTERELIRFRNIWCEYRKHSADPIAVINQIADDLQMTPDNVFLLALDQTRKGEIK